MKHTKKILLIVFFILMLLPFINTYIFYRAVPQLKGYFIKSPFPKFKTQNWYNHTFQDSVENYFNDNIGLRPFFVRVHNQVKYSLFNEIHANEIVRGKENYLYELAYLKAFNGTDFLGSVEIKHRVNQLKELHELLMSRNKTLVICLAPGKGSYYPEYFPEAYVVPETDSTNYKVYSTYLQADSFNFIDFNKWFLSMKDTSVCNLYPKYGIHWSEYGMYLATDSLIRFLEKERKTDLANMQLTNFRKSTDLEGTDYDIGETLNLLFPLKSNPMCYADVSWEKGKSRPKTLVISDSFYWSMYHIGVSTELFELGGFWYYNNEVYPDNLQQPTHTYDLDLSGKIAETEIIILMSTEANLKDFNWGFVDQALSVLKQ